MKRLFLMLLVVCLAGCARMGETTHASGEKTVDLAPQTPSGTKLDAEAAARAKAMAYCHERGFSNVTELELNTSVSNYTGPRCQVVKVPCPAAKKVSSDPRPGKMCLEHQCSENSRGWVSHLLFECH